jgi:hypothetical protein
MPAAEITAAVTSIRAAYDLTKAMIALRDADLLAGQARELNTLLLDVLDKSISAREAQAAQYARSKQKLLILKHGMRRRSVMSLSPLELVRRSAF